MAAIESRGMHAHPSMQRYYRRALPQMRRMVQGEITKDQLLLNLNHIAQQEGVVGMVNFDEFREGGYVPPWERAAEGGAAVHAASQGGA